MHFPCWYTVLYCCYDTLPLSRCTFCVGILYSSAVMLHSLSRCTTCSDTLVCRNELSGSSVWIHFCLLKCTKKASSYIAHYPVLRTIQSTLHFTSLTELFTQTPFRLLWEASSHMLQLMREGCSYTYPPLSIVRYSYTQLSELEQCSEKNLPMVLTPQHRIRTRVLAVESLKLCP